MSLVVDAGLTVGTLAIDVSFRLEPGTVTAVLGPNGAGKTSLLRTLAGLRSLERGTIELDATPLDDVARDVWVAPEERPVGLLFQDYLLFQHMSVLDNVAFGLRVSGHRLNRARQLAMPALEMFGLQQYATSSPSILSGGQAQRVALARTLAISPRVLLLDEPLAALDVGTRASVRADLRERLCAFEGIVMFVTHDPDDVVALADRVIVLDAGWIVADGSMAEVLASGGCDYIDQLARHLA